MCRPLMKRLAHKLGTRPAPMHPMLLPATRQHRRNSAVRLQFAGAAVAVALSQKYGADYGKSLEETRIWTLWVRGAKPRAIKADERER